MHPATFARFSFHIGCQYVRLQRVLTVNLFP